MNGGDKGMLERLSPEVIEECIRNINLADLHHTHGNNTCEDKPFHVGIQLKKDGQKANGKEANHRPEEDLKEGEHISFRNDPVLEYEGPYLNHVFG